ncbi:MAG: hypothetical protein WDO56_35555 [Gammaproteobacteria bacterium]
MDESPAVASFRRSPLPLILIAAVIQSWGLYGLGWASDHHIWLASRSGLFMALYALVTVLPLTLQFLADQRSQRLTWALAAAVGFCFAGFGWHFGHNVSNEPALGFIAHRASSEQILVGLVLWLLTLPFIQARLVTGRWWPEYPVFFAHAWRNLLTLAEAALFTGILWGLLYLCDALFEMLGISFFRELYREEIFYIPVTWLTFGISLHLITGMDRFASVVLHHLLNLLKWLALPAVAILALFAVSLAFWLHSLLATQKGAIEAGVLLWLAAFVVLLLNAAYRDGATEQPYPRFIGLAIRVIAPFTLFIALTAIWGLYVRTSAYGLTVPRTWGWIVAGTAIAFSIGYSICAVRKGSWMRGMGQVNVVVLLGLIATLSLALTPVLSPYRLTANSQFRAALSVPQPKAKASGDWRNDLYRTLRFDAGEYGKAKLAELSTIQNVPNAEEIRERARLALTRDYFEYRATIDFKKALATLSIHPRGRTLDASLSAAIAAAVPAQPIANYFLDGQETQGLFVDLTGDGTDEFVLITSATGMAFEQVNGAWKFSTPLSLARHCAGEPIGAELEAGRFSIRARKLADLAVGTRMYTPSPDVTCPK